MNKYALVPGVALAGLFAMPAVEAGLLYGHDTPGELYAIDTNAQTITSIGLSGGRAYNPEIELSSDGGTIYMGSKSGGLDLFHIDPSTGATQSNAGSVTGLANGNITAMEDDAGTLYAMDSTLTSSIFGTLDPTTAVFSAIGSTGVGQAFTGLAYAQGTLYGVTGTGHGPTSLYSIAVGTGLASLVAGITLSNVGIESVTSLAWSAEDTMMYTSISSGNNGALAAHLYSLDLTSGALTEEFGLNDVVIRGLDAPNAVPVPASILLLGIGVAGLSRLRRSA